MLKEAFERMSLISFDTVTVCDISCRRSCVSSHDKVAVDRRSQRRPWKNVRDWSDQLASYSLERGRRASCTQAGTACTGFCLWLEANATHVTVRWAVRMPVDDWFNDDGGCGVADADRESIEAVSVCRMSNGVLTASRTACRRQNSLYQRSCRDETWSTGHLH